MLEEFRDAEEECRGFLCAKGLSHIEQVADLGEEDPAFPRADGRLVEHSCLLEDGGLARRHDGVRYQIPTPPIRP